MITSYSGEFFSSIQEASRDSARIIVPIILRLIQPKSIIDVGCGDGTWLSVFRDCGVNDILGLDGEYVDRASLQIRCDQFMGVDLVVPFELARTFDLAISLEVAEHLPPESARGFVDSLTQLAPFVLFSAAIPSQGGTQHLNEQWPEYWAALFRDKDYLALDCIRGRVWTNQQVEWYYAQNILLFARADRVRDDVGLCRAYESTNLGQLALVHPTRFLQPFRCGVRDAFRLLTQAVINAARKRVPGFEGERY